MKTLSKIVAVFGLLILSTGAYADSPSGTDADALTEAGVNFIQSSDGKLIVLRTKKTTDAVNALVPDADIVDYAPSFEEAAVQRAREERRAERNSN